MMMQTEVAQRLLVTGYCYWFLLTLLMVWEKTLNRWQCVLLCEWAVGQFSLHTLSPHLLNDLWQGGADTQPLCWFQTVVRIRVRSGTGTVFIWIQIHRFSKNPGALIHLTPSQKTHGEQVFLLHLFFYYFEKPSAFFWVLFVLYAFISPYLNKEPHVLCVHACCGHLLCRYRLKHMHTLLSEQVRTQVGVAFTCNWTHTR